jgi:hypothetical protein
MKSNSAKKHMSEMMTNYDSLQHKENYISINLLCSMFYDGVKTLNSKSTSFWPLFMTILNLPPSFRTTSHAGIFLNSIFTSNMLKLFLIAVYNLLLIIRFA